MKQLSLSFDSMDDFCLKVFAGIGVATSSYLLLKILKKFCYVARMYVCSSHTKFSKYGSWSGMMVRNRLHAFT